MKVLAQRVARQYLQAAISNFGLATRVEKIALDLGWEVEDPTAPPGAMAWKSSRPGKRPPLTITVLPEGGFVIEVEGWSTMQASSIPEADALLRQAIRSHT